MMKKTSIFYFALLALCAMTVGCSDDDSYAPGEPSAVKGEGVYFAASNNTEFVKTETDEKIVDILLKRGEADGELTVPIEVVSKTENIVQVPAQVTFADGSKETTFQVRYSDLNSTPRCTMRIPIEYTNPYIQKNGSTLYEFSVYKLKVISDYVTYKAVDGSTDYFGGVTSTLVQYEGENKFIWRNFLGSGIDLKFKIDGTFDAYDVTKCNGNVVPLNHAGGDDSGDGWYLMNDEEGKEEGGYATWLPEGSSTAINDFIYFWNVYDGYSYFSIDLNATPSSKRSYGYAYVYCAVVDNDGNYNTFYTYFYY
ncbi:MAG: hypothetical protein ACI4T5_06925 [Prevotella sp.]